jgi:hypothetical protein
MTNLQVRAKVLALMLAGLSLAGCGEDMTQEPQPRPGVQEGRTGELVNEYLAEPRDFVPPEKSAMAGTSYLYFLKVCLNPDGTGCEFINGQWPDTYYDWNGTVYVWTRERYGDGSFYGTFAGSAVTWNGTTPYFEGGVYVGTDRRFQLQNVTSGSFSATIMGTDGYFRNASLYIY